jgi:hypothetical protein
MLRILHCAYFTPTAHGGWGLSCYFEGDSGDGKTEICSAYVKRIQYASTTNPLEILEPGGRGEGAFGVVPVPIVVNGRTYLSDAPPAWSIPFEQAQRGALFLDEMSTAPPMIQSAMLACLTRRYLAGAYLPQAVRMFGAGNPVEQAANGHDLAAALARRVSRIPWTGPNAEQMHEYFGRTIGSADPTAIQTGEAIDGDAEEARVLAAWPMVSSRILGTHRAWLLAQPQYLKQPRNDAEPTTSSRTHNLMIRSLVGAQIHGLTETEADMLAGGFVGAEALSAYRTFEANLDLPDIVTVLDGAPFDHDPKRADRTAAFVFGAEAFLKPRPTTPEAVTQRSKRAGRLFSLLESLPALSFDLVASAVMDLYRSGLSAVPGAERISARIYAFEQAMAKASK